MVKRFSLKKETCVGTFHVSSVTDIKTSIYPTPYISDTYFFQNHQNKYWKSVLRTTVMYKAIRMDSRKWMREPYWKLSAHKEEIRGRPFEGHIISSERCHFHAYRQPAPHVHNPTETPKSPHPQCKYNVTFSFLQLNFPQFKKQNFKLTDHDFKYRLDTF